MLGFHRRGVRRCEWETDIPKPGPLPQTSHTEATRNSWKSRSSTSARAVCRSRAGRCPTGSRTTLPDVSLSAGAAIGKDGGVATRASAIERKADPRQEPLGELLGPGTAKSLGTLGLETVGDLLEHLPRRYFERGKLTAFD